MLLELMLVLRCRGTRVRCSTGVTVSSPLVVSVHA